MNRFQEWFDPPLSRRGADGIDFQRFEEEPCEIAQARRTSISRPLEWSQDLRPDAQNALTATRDPERKFCKFAVAEDVGAADVPAHRRFAKMFDDEFSQISAMNGVDLRGAVAEGESEPSPRHKQEIRDIREVAGGVNDLSCHTAAAQRFREGVLGTHGQGRAALAVQDVDVEEGSCPVALCVLE